MNNLKDYQPDHLFLLMGSNPLPNYVASLLLGQNNPQLYLVHTTETEHIANNLAKNLPNDLPTPTYIQVDNANANNIYNKVEVYAKKCKGQIGLHYTGGTKAMAVHAYRAIENTGQDFTASYLDSKTLSLLIDQPGRNSITKPVGLGVKPSIKQLLKLHGYKLKNSFTTMPLMPKLFESLVQIPANELNNWCYTNLKEERNFKTQLKNKTNLRKVDLSSEILKPLHTNYVNLNTLEELEKEVDYRIDKLAKFIDGKWLEHYVLDKIKQLEKSYPIHEYALSVKPDGTRSFELDIVALQGYQLFAISCTTDARKSLIKSKLFEAYIRARQIGGDEAKVAVVCYAPKNDRYSNPQRIQQELEDAWHETKGNIRVFGEEHIPNLSQHLATWFQHSQNNTRS